MQQRLLAGPVLQRPCPAATRAGTPAGPAMLCCCCSCQTRPSWVAAWKGLFNPAHELHAQTDEDRETRDRQRDSPTEEQGKVMVQKQSVNTKAHTGLQPAPVLLGQRDDPRLGHMLEVDQQKRSSLLRAPPLCRLQARLAPVQCSIHCRPKLTLQRLKFVQQRSD